MKLDVLSLDNKKVGEVTLKEEVFALPARADILQRMVEWQRAKKRAGTHKVKTIGEISGTTKKPYRQKGTGNARQGSTRSPQFRGGATVFGPVVRDHNHDLTKKFRKLALKTALSVKAASGQIKVVDSLELSQPKTAELAQKIKNITGGSVFIIGGDAVDENFCKAASNLKSVHVLPQLGANVLDILKHETLILSKDAIERLEARLA